MLVILFDITIQNIKKIIKTTIKNKKKVIGVHHKHIHVSDQSAIEAITSLI